MYRFSKRQWMLCFRLSLVVFEKTNCSFSNRNFYVETVELGALLNRNLVRDIRWRYTEHWSYSWSCWQRFRLQWERGCNERIYFVIKLIDSNVETLDYDEHPHLCIFLLVVSGTQCNVHTSLHTLKTPVLIPLRGWPTICITWKTCLHL